MVIVESSQRLFSNESKTSWNDFALMFCFTRYNKKKSATWMRLMPFRLNCEWGTTVFCRSFGTVSKASIATVDKMVVMARMRSQNLAINIGNHWPYLINHKSLNFTIIKRKSFRWLYWQPKCIGSHASQRLPICQSDRTCTLLFEEIILSSDPNDFLDPCLNVESHRARIWRNSHQEICLSPWDWWSVGGSESC